MNSNTQCAAFTLVEILAAAVAAALIFLAVFGIFQRAIKTRNQAIERSHQSSQRARAVGTIRNDLRNVYISGTAGVLAATFEGGQTNQKSSLPGYLSFTATTGKDSPNEMYGDVQLVEYYISDGTGASGANSVGASPAGTLVRDVTRDLLDSTAAVVHEQSLLPNVQSLEITFYDGQTWQPSWSLSGSNTTTTTGTGSIVPDAIRIHVQQAPVVENGPLPPPMDIAVPWTTAPFHSGTISATGT